MNSKTGQLAFSLLAFSLLALQATAQLPDPQPVVPESLKWAGPPGNPSLQGAWVVGSEKATGPYALRVRLRKGGRIPPHTHPDTRYSTVLSGTLYVGFGEQMDDGKLVAVPAGAVYVAPAGVPHFLYARDDDVVYQEGGTGPTATLPVGQASQPAAAPCDDPGFREFDFWLGEWEVRRPDGALAGTNHIEREYGGCVVHERYRSEGGYRGESLNTYDQARKLWHQTWVDNQGTLLLLEGGTRQGSMVLEGQVTQKDGSITHHRITWTPEPDGTVRQLWEAAGQEGDWSTLFDGRYSRK